MISTLVFGVLKVYNFTMEENRPISVSLTGNERKYLTHIKPYVNLKVQHLAWASLSRGFYVAKSYA